MCDLFTMIIMSRSNSLLLMIVQSIEVVLLAIRSLLTMNILFSVSSCLESFVYNDTIDYIWILVSTIVLIKITV